MKTLILARHAKSSWKDIDLPDRERPLNKRGEKDAPILGKNLREQNLIPQVIYSSTALRCSQTAEIIAEKLNYHNEILYFDSLYLAEPHTYLELLRSLPDEIESVLIVGHNPGLEGLVQILSQRIESLPTAAVAALSVPVRSWSILSPQIDCQIQYLWRPKH
jgi:phosphohistidine phosphatase